MNGCKVVVTQKSIEQYSGGFLVCLVSFNGKHPRCDRIIKKRVTELFRLGDFKGKKSESLVLYPEGTVLAKKTAAKRVLLVGVGELKKELDDAEVYELLRNCGGNISAAATKVKTEELLLVLPEYLEKLKTEGVQHLLEGMLLGNYRFEKYKKKDEKKDNYSGIKKISIQPGARLGSIRKAVTLALNSSTAAMTARDMANEPANNWTPNHFAQFASSLAESSELTCTILEKNQINKAGMGGIIGVNKGSSTAPKLIILEHRPKTFSKTILLVGKGVTFDSGGISLKPAAGMQDMKYDMCGGAAVMATMQAVALEKPKVRVVAVVPATDNMSGSSAIKPGDIIKHYNGITSEVINTDAEGRLILADALAYGIKKYKPSCVIDLATLTGAVIIGLGHHRTGMMSNNDTLAKELSNAGDKAGEKLWRLPLDKEYSEQIESDVADIKNVGGRAGGSITAAAYLQKFVGKTPWAHLDIAGTAWEFTTKSYIPKGPSGIGVRTLLTFIRDWRSLKL